MSLDGLDYRLFQLINRHAGRVPALDATMRLLVNDFILPTAMAFLVAGLWFAGHSSVVRRPRQRSAMRAAVSLLLANLLVKMINLVYFRSRPFATHSVNLLFYRPSDSSLPSNPAVVGFSLALSIWPNHRRLGGGLLVLATIWSLARVFCGVHYPLDILAGAAVGGCAACLVVWLAPVLEPFYDRLIELGERLFLG